MDRGSLRFQCRRLSRTSYLGDASWIFAAKPFGRPPFCELLAAAGADWG